MLGMVQTSAGLAISVGYPAMTMKLLSPLCYIGWSQRRILQRNHKTENVRSERKRKTQTMRHRHILDLLEVSNETT